MNQTNASAKANRTNLVGPDKIVLNSRSSSFVNICVHAITETQASSLFSSLNVQKSSLHFPNKLNLICCLAIIKTPSTLKMRLDNNRRRIISFLDIHLNMVVASSKPNGYSGATMHIFFILSIYSHMQHMFLFSYQY